MLPKKRSATPGRTTQETFARLTTREREVAALISQGKSTREIAEELAVSERTVASHIRNVLSKLGLVSRGQIAVWVTKKGLGKTEREDLASDPT
jgi:DNA-binding NarL/FixJ family response regulator